MQTPQLPATNGGHVHDAELAPPKAARKGFTDEDIEALESAWGSLEDGDIGRVNAGSFQLIFRRPNELEFKRFKVIVSGDNAAAKAVAQEQMAATCIVGVWNKVPGEAPVTALATDKANTRPVREALAALKSRRAGAVDNDAVTLILKRLLSEEAEAVGKD